MHFGLIIGNNFFGGCEQQMALLARGLMKAGHKATVICTDSPHHGLRLCRKKQLDYSGIPTLRLCLRRGFKHFYYPYGQWRIKHMKFDLLIGNHADNALAGLKLANGQIPVITHIAGLKFSRPGQDAAKKNMQQALQGSLMAISNAQIAFDAADKLQMLQGKPRRVIYNAVNPPRGYSVPQNGRFQVIFVGSLYNIKDPMTLIKALAVAKKSIPHLTAVLVGDGVMRQEIEDYLDRNSLTGFITLTGQISNEEIPYQNSDLFVNCSISELSSGAIAEALSHGVPALGSRVGGTPEILDGHEFSALFEAGDVSTLANLIVKFGSKPYEERLRLGKLAAEYANRKFGLDSFVDSYIKLGEDIIGGNL